MQKRTIGSFFILLSLLVWLVDRLTNTVSTLLGKIIYGNHYMHTENGMLGDLSFNIDMYLAYSLFTLLLFGILLYYSSMKETVQRETV